MKNSVARAGFARHGSEQCRTMAACQNRPSHCPAMLRPATCRIHATLCALALGLTFGVAALPAQAQPLPGFEQVRGAYRSTESLLLDRNGQTLALTSFAREARQLEWVPLTALSPAMREALLAAEDRRFFEHSGVDWRAFVGAAWQNLWQRTPRGASTLTMQLVGLLDPQLQLPKGARRSYGQKLDQTLAARDLEQRWSKAQILEAYLNLAPFRGQLKGLGAASEVLFGVKPQAITRREAVILAALLRGPNAAPGVVAKRACQLAQTLRDGNACPAITRLAGERLPMRTGTDTPTGQAAPHMARQWLRQPGMRVRTTLDGALQSRITQILHSGDASPNSRASAVLIDNASGEILAWVGATNAAEADGVLQKRIVQGAMIPQLAARALDRRSHTAASLLPMDPVTNDQDNGAPNWYSLRTALSQGLSGPLRRLGNADERAVGEIPVIVTLDAGVEVGSGPHGGSGLAESSLLQLANAWRTLPAGGQFVAARGMPENLVPRRAFSPEAAFLTLDMLGRNTQGWQGNWQIHAAPGQAVIMLGSNVQYTLALAVGSDGLDTSQQRAATLWQTLQSALGAPGGEAASPGAPDGLVNSLVYFEPAVEPPRRELFLRGGVMERSVAGMRGTRILFPRNARYAISNSGTETWALEAGVIGRWQLNGKFLGEGQRVFWRTQAGRHQLRLLDTHSGSLLDSLDFEIEAAPLGAPSGG